MVSNPRLSVIQSVLITTAVLLAPAGGSAQTPTEQNSSDPTSLYQEGQQRYEANDFLAARNLWIKAYKSVPDGVEHDANRILFLQIVVTATIDLKHADPDEGAAAARQTREFFDAIESTFAGMSKESRETTKEERARLQEAFPDIGNTNKIELAPPKEHVEDVPGPTPTRAPVPSEVPRTDDAPEIQVDPTDEPRRHKPQSRTMGITLATSGALLAAGGLSSIIAGSRFVPRANDQLDAADANGDPSSSEHRQNFLDTERTKGVAWIGVGGGIAAVGVGLLVAGIVKLRSNRNDGERLSRRLSIGLSPGRRKGMIHAHVFF